MSKKERDLIVLEKKEEAADFIVEQWSRMSKEAIEARGMFCVALSGGETPEVVYKKLAARRNENDWSKTHVFFVDERFVPLNSKESNYGMIKKHLLDKVKIPQENIHHVPIEDNVFNSAQKYEDQILGFFSLNPGEFPQLDLVLLGIGADGHTASLFPEDPALEETSRLACPVQYSGVTQERVTITLPVINDALRVLFFVAGRNKADILHDLFEGKNDSSPVMRVHPILNPPLFVLDNEAAEKI